MKFNSQFDETEIANNFDIATLRIYIENYIGRVRDWQILNKCWPSGRIDFLLSNICTHSEQAKETSWAKVISNSCINLLQSFREKSCLNCNI